jgi:hypothetical protein
VTVTEIHPTVPTARRPAAPSTGRRAEPSYVDRGAAPVAALRLPGHVLRAVGPLLEDAGFDVLDITTHERGPRPSLVVLELPDDEEAGRRLLAPPPSGPGRLFLAAGDVPAWATLQWAADEIVRSPFHRLQVVAAALRVGRVPTELVSSWAEHAFDDLGPTSGRVAPGVSRCA